VQSTSNSAWLDILDELYQGSWNPELRRHRSPFAFRGMNRFEHSLGTTLVRLAAGRADPARLEDDKSICERGRF
jgi:hypothetical protein